MPNTPSTSKPTTKSPRRRIRTAAEIKAELEANDKAEKKKKEDARTTREALRRELDEAARRDETRRKILAGSWLLAEIGNDKNLRDRFNAALPTYLVRDDDRGLFDLAPLPQQWMRIDLNVPIEQKDSAKAIGARWDRNAKLWYVPAGVDPAPFLAKWSRAETTPATTAPSAPA